MIGALSCKSFVFVDRVLFDIIHHRSAIHRSQERGSTPEAPIYNEPHITVDYYRDGHHIRVSHIPYANGEVSDPTIPVANNSSLYS